MEKKLILFMLLCIMLFGVACGGAENTATAVPPTSPPNNPQTAVEPTLLPEVEVETVDTQAVSTGCEEYFLFCVTSAVSGAVNAEATAGVGGSASSCAAWAEGGEPRILEMPFMIAAGDSKITVALTRISAYTGPGSYELTAVTDTGMPDMFPAIEADGRTFSNGDGSTAVVTVAADGSGTVTATGLVEQASVQVSNPDPDAKVDFSMQWTCQEQGG